MKKVAAFLRVFVTCLKKRVRKEKRRREKEGKKERGRREVVLIKCPTRSIGFEFIKISLIRDRRLVARPRKDPPKDGLKDIKKFTNEKMIIYL